MNYYSPINGRIWDLNLFKWELSKLYKNIYDFELKDIDGKLVKFSKFQGRVLLIVNVASQCGFTPQYSGLQKLYETYRDQGLSVLAFPCNDFGAQEPDADSVVKNFCEQKYRVTFDLFSKLSILGREKAPLYQCLYDYNLKSQGAGGLRSTLFKLIKWFLHRKKGVLAPRENEAEWNFHKFLVGKDGVPVASFLSEVAPDSQTLAKTIEEELRK